jgi:hypothetical protein
VYNAQKILQNTACLGAVYTSSFAYESVYDLLPKVVSKLINKIHGVVHV